MALRFPARVKAQTSTTGVSTYAVSEPGQQGYRTLTRAVSDGDLADGDSLAYIVIDTTVTDGPNLLEIGVGVWNNTAKTLTRATVYQPNGVPISWGAGTRDILVIDNPVLFLLLAGGTMTGILNILISGSIISPATETSLLVQRSVSTSTDVGLSLVSGTIGKSRVNLGDTANEKDGGVYYDNNTQTLYFRTANTDRQRIDSAGVFRNSSSVPYDAFESGTALPFFQAAAPSGWTKSTTHNDKALRVVSGSGGGSGGSLSLSAANVGNTALTIAQMPVHTHDYVVSTAGGVIASPSQILGDGGSILATQATGSGSNHTHTLSLAYIDVIVCVKN